LIPPDVISSVRERTNIVAVIQESVPTLKRKGRTFVGLCPFHKEKTGSFNVNPDRGFFHCFGCKESGSVIDFVMKHDGYTFPEAVKMLAERAGITFEETRLDDAERDAQAIAKKKKDDLYGVSALAATYFEAMLREHPDRQYALDELGRRGLLPGTNAKVDDALQAFRIGYAPAGWDGLATFLRAQSASPIGAESVGLLVPRPTGSGHYDRFRHRLMFAVVDPQGRVIAFSGRALAEMPSQEAKENKGETPKYINSPESPIYTKGAALFGLFQARHEIRVKDSAVVVEGNFDVVSLHARGLQNVVAPLGTAFTVDQAKLLKRFASGVTLLFDGDAAGRKATRLSREPLKQAGLTARVASLPQGVDPDDVARTKGVVELESILKRARGMLEHLIDTALDESFSSADIYEKVARITYVGQLIAGEENSIARTLAKSYADQLAGRLDIVRDRSGEAFRALELTIRKAVAEAGPRPAPGRGADPRTARVDPRRAGSACEQAIVGALLEFPELIEDPTVAPLLDELEGMYAQAASGIAKAWNLAGITEAKEKTKDGTLFLARLPEAIHPFAFERLAAPEHETVDEARASLFENGTKLRQSNLERETTQIAREQEKVLGDERAEDDLLREALLMQRERHGVRGVADGNKNDGDKK
jgi:DNA primase